LPLLLLLLVALLLLNLPVFILLLVVLPPTEFMWGWRFFPPSAAAKNRDDAKGSVTLCLVVARSFVWLRGDKLPLPPLLVLFWSNCPPQMLSPLLPSAVLLLLMLPL
jgi:hypothetical protein